MSDPNRGLCDNGRCRVIIRGMCQRPSTMPPDIVCEIFLVRGDDRAGEKKDLKDRRPSPGRPFFFAQEHAA